MPNGVDTDSKWDCGVPEEKSRSRSVNAGSKQKNALKYFEGPGGFLV